MILKKLHIDTVIHNPIVLYDSNNNRIYYENSNGFFYIKEFDSNNNEIYCENSNGTIYDNIPKETKRLTHKEICELIGYNVEIIKEKE